jgi:hypothetical protein
MANLICSKVLVKNWLGFIFVHFQTPLDILLKKMKTCFSVNLSGIEPGGSVVRRQRLSNVTTSKESNSLKL